MLSIKDLFLSVILVFVLSTLAQAQSISAGVYGGVTTPAPHQTSWMGMADVGTTLDVEPWVQSFGTLVQVGVDVIGTAYHGLGATVGIYSNTRTERYGVTYSIGQGQVRLLRTSSGLWQGIGYYNFNLSKGNYVQVWLAPAQGGSSYLVGVGHTFRQ